MPANSSSPDPSQCGRPCLSADSWRSGNLTSSVFSSTVHSTTNRPGLIALVTPANCQGFGSGTMGAQNEDVPLHANSGMRGSAGVSQRVFAMCPLDDASALRGNRFQKCASTAASRLFAAAIAKRFVVRTARASPSKYVKQQPRNLNNYGIFDPLIHPRGPFPWGLATVRFCLLCCSLPSPRVSYLGEEGISALHV